MQILNYCTLIFYKCKQYIHIYLFYNVNFTLLIQCKLIIFLKQNRKKRDKLLVAYTLFYTVLYTQKKKLKSDNPRKFYIDIFNFLLIFLTAYPRKFSKELTLSPPQAIIATMPPSRTIMTTESCQDFVSI